MWLGRYGAKGNWILYLIGVGVVYTSVTHLEVHTRFCRKRLGISVVFFAVLIVLITAFTPLTDHLTDHVDRLQFLTCRSEVLCRIRILVVRT